MGFRSTFAMQDYRIQMPMWFIEKWREDIYFYEGHSLPLSSKHEGKLYEKLAGLERDIQAAIDWDAFRIGKLVMVWLHECGGITWVQIERDRIVYAEPGDLLQVTEPSCPNTCEGSEHYRDSWWSAND